ncbi:hypothetical protein FS837_008911 [Tulasnella sp. UAMH 9824]|nr:hypothetical protein FS837_008911 [Tulasnella sp. UAMH 9824]
MHLALSLPEILGHILQNLGPSDLASCTTVSRHFWEEATPVLWEEVTLADCAQLLPGVTCTEIPTERMGVIGFTIPSRGQRPVDKLRYRVNVKRELQPADWLRFQVHAPLVKQLRLPSSVNHNEIFPVLKDRGSSDPLFRNLRGLQVEEVEPSHKQSKFLSLFTSPTMYRVDVRQSRPDSVLAESVIPAIPRLFPALSSLTIHLPSYTMRAAETVIDAVKLYSSLSRLDIRTTPQELAQVVELASQMGSLTHATFMGVGNPDNTLPDDSFKLLQSLCVEGRGVEGIRRIASSVTSPDLQRLDVTWAPESTTVSDADYLPSLDRFHKLKILRINAPVSFFLQSCLAPTLNCHGLEEVSIRCRSSDFSQEVLRTMAQSWPRLRHLDLAPAGPVLTGIPSLGMLRCFAEFCPGLESLSARVRLDLADDALNEMKQEAPGLGSALRRINVGRSVIILPESETEEIVEQALKDVTTSLLASWPNLITFGYDTKSVYADGWARLQRALDLHREELSAPPCTHAA